MKLPRLPLLPIFYTFFLDNFGLSIVYPIFTPLFLQPELGILPMDTPSSTRTLLLGFLISSFSFAQLFGAPLIGELSDRIGRKRAFYTTILGTTVGYFLTALSIMFQNLFLLFTSRLLAGFFAGNQALCLAAIADIRQEEHVRTKNFGFLGSAGGLSFIVGILLGGLLSNSSKSNPFLVASPFWMICILSIINFFLMKYFFKESFSAEKKSSFHFFKGVRDIAHAFKNARLRFLYLTYFFFVIAWITSMQFFPTFVILHFHASPFFLTFLLSAIGFLWFFTNFFINRPLASRLRPEQTINGALILLSTFLFLCLFSDQLSLFFLFFALAACMAALSWTNILASVSLNASKDSQGCTLGINQSIGASAAILGPSIGGALAGFHESLVYLFTVLASFAAFFFSTHPFKRKSS